MFKCCLVAAAVPVMYSIAIAETSRQVDELAQPLVDGQAVVGCVVGIVDNGALSIDNNLSVRMVRPVAIGRKNYLFLGSEHGGKTAAVLYSIMASAKANQVEPFAYVRDLLTQLSRNTPPAVGALLPDAWLAAHPDSRRCWSR